uniref:Uncharacterized protein n=1 Tax=Hyaloperonospora arabidopsidis (strain Emoy2) TaxID=559515 RepID=M4B5Z9_HYAAE
MAFEHRHKQRHTATTAVDSDFTLRYADFTLLHPPRHPRLTVARHLTVVYRHQRSACSFSVAILTARLPQTPSCGVRRFMAALLTYFARQSLQLGDFSSIVRPMNTTFVRRIPSESACGWSAAGQSFARKHTRGR